MSSALDFALRRRCGIVHAPAVGPLSSIVCGSCNTNQLAQLLRNRYGQKRERIDENQLFLFAAQIIAASQRASAATSSGESTADSLISKEKEETKRVVMVAGHCPKYWNVGGWCLTWWNHNGNASTAKRRCRRSGKMSANG
jgi:Transposase C of IS166 homeodomain